MSAGLWTARELRVGWECRREGEWSQVQPQLVQPSQCLRALFHCLKVKSGRHGIHPPF